ncbi:MAG: YitT family protein [Ardenticatenaceae bacterium]|nr:YitT family protein [Anaerolineales bacterium]MCB8920484.1 YitT family protein [Ardenticatenaceae bacterium]MCB8989438.1 YitT family protein [Ardenticatenaceae bacterium]MCB9005024.1 YitT family protein [Ardenticatenaceae bacterium]
MKKQFQQKKLLTQRTLWHALQTTLYLLAGTGLAALGYALFQVPNNIVSGGLSGVAIMVNHYTDWPVGLMYWVMNVPMLVLGFFQLGRWRFVVSTLISATIFSVLVDLFGVILPQVIAQFPLSHDVLLTSVYAGIIGGIGAGLVYRAGSTFGGTAVVGRVIQQRTGLPLSQVYAFTDGAVILIAGLIFGWEIAMYGFLVLFINGLAADYTLEGPSSTRTVTIITNKPKEIADALIEQTHRGVSYWQVTGGYTGEMRHMVSCTVYRPQVNAVKRIVAEVESEAFVTIGVSHQALGKGFKRLR